MKRIWMLCVVAACATPAKSSTVTSDVGNERQATEPRKPRPFAGFEDCELRFAETMIGGSCGGTFVVFAEADAIAIENVRRTIARLGERFPKAIAIREGVRRVGDVEYRAVIAEPAVRLPIAARAELVIAGVVVAGCVELGTSRCDFAALIAEGPSRLAAARAAGEVRSVSDPLAALRAMAASAGGVSLSYALAADVPRQIERLIVETVPSGPVDLVFVVDTTGSMTDDIAAVKRDLHAIHAVLAAKSSDYRIGVVAYRDTGDEYVAKTVLKASSDRASIDRAIESLVASGGGDMPEHVYAGLERALTDQPFRDNASHHILAIGDARAHEFVEPDQKTVLALAAKRDVHLHTVLLDCDILCRGLIGVTR